MTVRHTGEDHGMHTRWSNSIEETLVYWDVMSATG